MRRRMLDGRVRIRVRPVACLAEQIKDAGRSLWWCQRRARGRRAAKRRARYPGVRGRGIGHLARSAFLALAVPVLFGGDPRAGDEAAEEPRAPACRLDQLGDRILEVTR